MKDSGNVESVASFSRALFDGLQCCMSKEKFDNELNNTFDAIYRACLCKI
jgi:fructose-bisphosphate aldolase class 1